MKSHSTLLSVTNRLMEEALHQLLPRVCGLCAQTLRGTAEQEARLCAHCVEALPGRLSPRCPRCALSHPLPVTGPEDRRTSSGLSPGQCLIEKTGERLPWDAALAWVDYDYPVDGWVHALKFQGEASLARGMGWGLAQAVRDAPACLRQRVHQLDALVPLPLSDRRLARRGFNQTLLIGRAFRQCLLRQAKPGDTDADKSPSLEPGWLKRVRHGPPLSLLDAPDRKSLMADAYGVPGAARRAIEGLRIGLIDDVMTTGASLTEACRSLKAVGAKEVIVMVVARTEPGISGHHSGNHAGTA